MQLQQEYIVLAVYLCVGEFYSFCILFLLHRFFTFSKWFQTVQVCSYNFFNVIKANQDVSLLILFSSKA